MCYLQWISERKGGGEGDSYASQILIGISAAVQIFKLADLTDKKRDFAPVLATLRELYGIAEGE